MTRLADGLRLILGDSLLGLYLHGSLAMGAFNTLRSDVDLLVVTAAPAGNPSKRELAGLLLAVSQDPHPVEISVLSWDDLHPWRHPAPFDFHFSETWRPRFAADLASGAWRSWMHHDEGDSDLAAHVTVTQARGVTIVGCPIAEVLPLVPRAHFIDSLRQDVLDEHFGLAGRMEAPVYVVLNACRTWVYLRCGQILSKEEGGRQALPLLPRRLRPLVEAALEAYAGCGYPDHLPAEELREFAAYMRRRIGVLMDRA